MTDSYSKKQHSSSLLLSLFDIKYVIYSEFFLKINIYFWVYLGVKTGLFVLKNIYKTTTIYLKEIVTWKKTFKQKHG